MQSPLKLLSVEEYLQRELKAQVRHEYVAGQIYAMVGASQAHNIIAGNIFALLRSHVRGSFCRAFISDMKVNIKANNNSSDLFYYPDVVVSYDPKDNNRYFLDSPSLICEVLSPSIQVTDKREKRLNYQTIDSLKEYVLISQDEIKVEIYRKNDLGEWTIATLRENDSLELSSVGLNLTMADIYEDAF